ncbi:MAG: hypothetical protein PWP23_84 [Candidatus Sumerlaeota bacterium]|nr:hypothetical protein [Candidatus Sumerlaeota bacterium]
MQGSLQQVPLPEVLQFISMGKSSGILKLRRDRSEISLTISHGRIINSSALDRRRRIGDLLVNRGLLKRSELSRLLAVQRTVESDKRLGQILVERDIITEDTIRETLRLQLEEEIWNLFAWKDGEFFFENVPPNQLGDEIVTIEIEPLILEGTRRNDEWQKIIAVIPNDRLVLTVTTVGDDFERTLQLRPDEWQVLSQVNGHFTVRAIVNRSNMGRFEVHRILSQFIKSGLLVVSGEGGGQSATGTEEPGTGNETQDESAPESQNEKPLIRPERGVGGMLSTLIGGSRGKEKADARTRASFVSPIGALANIAMEFYRRVRAMKEFAPAAGDDSLIDRVWFDLVQVYTKADLVRVKDNTIDCSVLEKYLECCEFGEAVDECFEDAFEGQMHLLRALYQVASKRVGERISAKAIRDLLDELNGNLSLKYRKEVPMIERIQMVLKLT